MSKIDQVHLKKGCNAMDAMYVKDVEDYIMQHYMESTHYIGALVKDVKGVKYYG